MRRFFRFKLTGERLFCWLGWSEVGGGLKRGGGGRFEEKSADSFSEVKDNQIEMRTRGVSEVMVVDELHTRTSVQGVGI